MADWPSTLPQSPITDGLNYVKKDGVIRTTMEAGPQKRRRRYTATGEDCTMQIPMTRAQTMILDNFYYTTLGDGVLTFMWRHFKRVGFPPAEYYFKGPPQYSLVGGDVWRANLELFRMP